MTNSLFKSAEFMFLLVDFETTELPCCLHAKVVTSSKEYLPFGQPNKSNVFS